jgi:hypothetical protein
MWDCIGMIGFCRVVENCGIILHGRAYLHIILL